MVSYILELPRILYTITKIFLLLLIYYDSKLPDVEIVQFCTFSHEINGIFQVKLLIARLFSSTNKYCMLLILTHDLLFVKTMFSLNFLRKMCG